jgi:transcription antitermination factor NusG
MPILREEPSLYPENLLDEVDPEPTNRRWWVLYTKARQEKAVSRELFAYKIPFFLPLVKKASTRRGRKVQSHVPIFGSYVFMYGSEEERVRSLMTNRISRSLTVDDVDGLVSDLRQLHQLITSEEPLTVESRLVPGNKVRVLGGSFEGLEGTVLNRRGKVRLLVAINFLQQGASVEIDDHLLEPIG